MLGHGLCYGKWSNLAYGQITDTQSYPECHSHHCRLFSYYFMNARMQSIVGSPEVTKPFHLAILYSIHNNLYSFLPLRTHNTMFLILLFYIGWRVEPMDHQFYLSLKDITTILFVLHLNRQTNVFISIYHWETTNQLPHLFIFHWKMGGKQWTVLTSLPNIYEWTS